MNLLHKKNDIIIIICLFNLFVSSIKSDHMNQVYVNNEQCIFAIDDRAYCADIKKLFNGQFCLAINSNESILLMIIGGLFKPIYLPIMHGKMSQINQILIDQNQRILVFGSTSIDNKSHIFVTRYLPSLIQDISFGENGFFDFIIEDATSFSKCALQANGNIVCIGRYNKFGTIYSFLFCLNNSGQLDRNFGDNGIFHYHQNIYLQDLLVDSDDKILIGGFFENNIYITDFTFNTDVQNFRIKIPSEEKQNNDYLSMHLMQHNRSIFVALNTHNHSEIIKIELSSDKIMNAIKNQVLTQLDYPLQGICIDASNKFIGWFNRNGKINLVKYDLDGQLDHSFGKAGVLQSRIGKYSAIAQLIEDTNNKYIIVGSSEESVLFAKYNKNSSSENIVINYSTSTDKNSYIYGVALPTKNIKITVDGIKIGFAISDVLGNWYIVYDALLTNGKHCIQARYADTDELCAEKEITLNYPDSIEFIAPEKAARVSNISSIRGNCSRAHMSILIFIDGKFNQRITSDSLGYWELKSVLLNKSGEHVVSVQLMDDTGKIIAHSATYFEIIKSSNFIIKLLGW